MVEMNAQCQHDDPTSTHIMSSLKDLDDGMIFNKFGAHFYPAVVFMTWGLAWAHRLFREAAAAKLQRRRFDCPSFVTIVQLGPLRLVLECILVLPMAILLFGVAGLVVIALRENGEMSAATVRDLLPEHGGNGLASMWGIIIISLSVYKPKLIPKNWDKIIVIITWLSTGMTFADHVFYKSTPMTRLVHAPYAFWALLAALAFIAHVIRQNGYTTAVWCCLAMVGYGLNSLLVSLFFIGSRSFVDNKCQLVNYYGESNKIPAMVAVNMEMIIALVLMYLVHLVAKTNVRGIGFACRQSGRSTSNRTIQYTHVSNYAE